MKKHLFSYAERYSDQNSIFIGAERKYFIKIVWATPKLLLMMNVLDFGLYYPSNICDRFISCRIIYFTLNSSRSKHNPADSKFQTLFYRNSRMRCFIRIQNCLQSSFDNVKSFECTFGPKI